ncbi:UvrD-helicase domain-containing protein [Cognatiluteimonas profundi]|uniref:UvrD-helicase domain-containing protein n=1 Tax=Cognatiluteimonas profundi TaxID=2594501 RepID=UPI00131C1039|nr:exodeoxyribonuclease V subunit beta [Lysobacter profundi]
MSDAVFDTRLDARTLLEASAGTGKTWALAGLFVRAVIVGRRRVPDILAVTYTVAATRELRTRVRARLQQAATLALHWQPGDAALRDGDDAEAALLRRLLHAALAAGGESLPALRQRMQAAARDIDLAAIHTIHGFCQRLLAEHAVDTGQPLLAADLEVRNRAARMRLAVDLWRASLDDVDVVAFLQMHFRDPAGLAAELGVLLADEPLLPPAPDALPDDPRPGVAAAWRAVRAAFDDHGEDTHAALHDAIAAKFLHNGQYKPEHVDALWAWCARHAHDVPPAECHERLAKYLPQALLAGTSKGGVGRTPDAPLFAAFSGFVDALARLVPYREARDLQCLHALRARARALDIARKQAFHLRDYDDLIGAAHAAVTDPRHAQALADAVRAQFPLALVDEFQDTDARQWTIFRTLFGSGGLVLVGDPKQAIYRFRGGDVHTYLGARASADAVASLDQNFRSRPLVLRVVEALFAQSAADAMGAGIAFQPVRPGGRARDDDLQHDGVAAPAIEVHVVPPAIDRRSGKPKDWNRDESVAIAASLCADAIRERLQAARDGDLLRRDGDATRALEPRDCAVLVRTHREAEAMRRALSRRGVPAVAGGRISLFETDEATTLLTLLLALRNAGDDRRLRAALATRLLGQDAAAIAALDADGDALRDWQQRFQDWRARWERHGPQALLSEVVAANAARLLSEPDGERRVANLMQLAELMQEAGARSLGTQGQLDALRAAIADADADDEAQQPRLESDAGRVQILTLHKSKGLEFPLVFLPFCGIGRRSVEPGTWAMYPTDAGRVRQWKTVDAHAGAPSWGEASALHVVEEQAEDMRLLYVGLTRARDALWLACGAFANQHNTALARLLGDQAQRTQLHGALAAAATWSEGLPSTELRRLPPLPGERVPPARIATRVLRRDWWIHSFSQLHQQQSQGAQVLADEAPADDERRNADVAIPSDPRFSGIRFGNALHHALEHAHFGAWAGIDGGRIPDGERAVLLAALRHEHYRDADLDDGVRALAPLVARTLNAPLPTTDGEPDIRLCELADSARIAELEFHFTLRDAATRDFVALLQRHGLLRERGDFGIWHSLSGLMTGKLDLTYRVGGRLYVLDYKSNLLPAYDPATLAARMAASEYDLQALLYAVALHRWMRVRLADYDFDRHFGGARYVFSRGLDPRDPALGVSVPRLTRTLVEAADALLGSPMPEQARAEPAWA